MELTWNNLLFEFWNGRFFIKSPMAQNILENIYYLLPCHSLTKGCLSLTNLYTVDSSLKLSRTELTGYEKIKTISSGIFLSHVSHQSFFSSVAIQQDIMKHINITLESECNHLSTTEEGLRSWVNNLCQDCIIVEKVRR